MRKALMIAVLLPLVLVLAAPPKAEALFHFMVIDEIYGGSSSTPDVQFVELRMTFPIQVIVAGHTIAFRNADGSQSGTFATLTHAVVGLTGRRILACTLAAQTFFKVPCDAIATGRLLLPDGAVAWAPDAGPYPADFVRYGNFTGLAPPEADDAPALILDQSLQRTTDTAGVGMEFAYATPTPTNNLGIRAP